MNDNFNTQFAALLTDSGMMTAAFADSMSAAGYEISDQLFNALEAEFAAVLEAGREEGNFTGLDIFLDSLGYSAGRALRALNNQ